MRPKALIGGEVREATPSSAGYEPAGGNPAWSLGPTAGEVTVTPARPSASTNRVRAQDAASGTRWIVSWDVPAAMVPLTVTELGSPGSGVTVSDVGVPASVVVTVDSTVTAWVCGRRSRTAGCPTPAAATVMSRMLSLT